MCSVCVLPVFTCVCLCFLSVKKPSNNKRGSSIEAPGAGSVAWGFTTFHTLFTRFATPFQTSARSRHNKHVEHDGSKGGESAFGAGPGGSGSMSHPWQKTEPVGVKTDGLAKSEAYGLWQYDMTSRRCRQIARVEIQTHALHIYTHNTI